MLAATIIPAAHHQMMAMRLFMVVGLYIFYLTQIGDSLVKNILRA
jgi:hypothetical protein